MSITLPGVPEGWELVRWGLPKEGESFVCGSGAVFTAAFDYDTVYHLVVRKIWTPPEDLKLKPGRIFINSDEWFWTDGEAKPCGDPAYGFYSRDTVMNLTACTNFIGPDVTPENSLIEIAGDQ